jgi:NTE family protein
MNIYSLVLAGGGGKGAYQIGAWRALRELGVSFDAIAGVSIGSLNGALIASGDYDKAVEMWKSVSVDKGVKIDEPLPDPENLFSKKNWGVLFKEFVKNKGFDASPTKDFVSQFISEEKVRKSKMPLGFVTVQMTQGITPL